MWSPIACQEPEVEMSVLGSKWTYLLSTQRAFEYSTGGYWKSDVEKYFLQTSFCKDIKLRIRKNWVILFSRYFDLQAFFFFFFSSSFLTSKHRPISYIAMPPQVVSHTAVTTLIMLTKLGSAPTSKVWSGKISIPPGSNPGHPAWYHSTKATNWLLIFALHWDMIQRSKPLPCKSPLFALTKYLQNSPNDSLLRSATILKDHIADL